MGKPEGKKPLGRPRHRWVDNIELELTEIGWDGINQIDLDQDRGQWRALVNMVMNLRFCDFLNSHLPQNREKHKHPFSVPNSRSHKTLF